MTRDVQFTFHGVPIRVGRMWLFVSVALVAITINSLAPSGTDALANAGWYISALIVVAGVILSLFLHEFAHVAVARRTGHRIHVIRPPLIGSLTDDAYPPENPRDEVWVAIVGPTTNLILGLLAGVGWLLLRDDLRLISGILGFIAVVNVAIAAANYMPGLPFDGGRLFRAFIWYLTDDLLLGTRFASTYGNFIALIGMIAGLVMLSLGDALSIWGAWALFCFWVINREGRDGYMRVVWREASKNISVDEAGLANSRRVNANRTIDDALDDLLQATVEGPLLVVDGDELIGIVSLAQIRKVPRAIWTERTIRDVSVPLVDTPSVSSETTLLALVQSFESSRTELILVETRGRITGVVDRDTTYARVRDRIREERAERRRRKT